MFMNQIAFTLEPYPRGFHIITDEILYHVQGHLPETGILHLFIKHTSAALSINENADPDVLHDMENITNHIVPENLPFLRHTLEGPDDMPAHVKSAFYGSSITVPITGHRLNLGVWQGIYLCEFRNRARPRSIVATILS